MGGCPQLWEEREDRRNSSYNEEDGEESTTRSDEIRKRAFDPNLIEDESNNIGNNGAKIPPEDEDMEDDSTTDLIFSPCHNFTDSDATAVVSWGSLDYGYHSTDSLF